MGPPSGYKMAVEVIQTPLMSLKSAKTVGDVAAIIGYKAQTLSYVLYYKEEATKYTQFEIPKKGGGTRKISVPSPDLKLIQEKLSNLLQDCVDEINILKDIRDRVAHGFKRNRSIISNAKEHKNRRYVFNVDISDFFGSINFGRVYGFFMKDLNFNLDSRVAAVIGRIACYDDALPQGSPCSPAISNLIGHIMDVHLVRLAKKHGCTYTRYADDLTFSTNNPLFPKEIAFPSADNPNLWLPGKDLVGLVTKSRFKLNPAKTRMQYKDSRQEVTGLIVNRKVNVRNEYRRKVRAMVYRLFTTGNFNLEHKSVDEAGNQIKISNLGSINQLHGMLGFIDSIDLYNQNLTKEALGSLYVKKENAKAITTKEAMFRRFLFFKEFYTANKPVIVCEGNTDNIYLTHAIRSLSSAYPLLAETTPEHKINLKIRLFKYADTSTGRILKMGGGFSDLARFIADYSKEQTRFKALGEKFPVIVLFDNDSAAAPILKAISEVKKMKVESAEPFVHISGNLYALATPLLGGTKTSCIEDFFDASATKTTIDGKTFDPSKTADKTKTFDKVVFAHKVVVPQAATLNFTGFNQLLTNLTLLINDHLRKHPPA